MTPYARDDNRLVMLRRLIHPASSAAMVIETRIAGKKARSLDRWSIPTPPTDNGDGGGGITLRDLITRVVRAEVSAFEKREQARRLIRVLSDTEIAEGAARGKVDS